jgi:VWFA-related protein
MEPMAPLLLLAASVSLSQTQEPRVPEFRADVRMIRLDVSVVDGRGQPISGLLPQDFRVTEDGRPVEVSYFEAVQPDLDGAPSDAVADESRRPSRPRRIVLLVDTPAMSHGQLIRARESAARYLREATVDGDWVRLVNLSSGRVRDGWVPQDRTVLEAAALSLTWRRSAWGDFASDESPITDTTDERGFGSDEGTETSTAGRFLSVFAQTHDLLGQLEALLTEMQGVDGRKAVVLISPGFPPMRNLDRTLEHVATLAREASAAVYFVDATGFDSVMPQPGVALKPVFETVWAASGGSQDLAEATGGFTFRFGNSLVPALARIGGEMRTYYVLGYASRRPEDGRFRAVKVKVNAPGATARTKKGYLAGLAR